MAVYFWVNSRWHFGNGNHRRIGKKSKQQECIPVGCVPPARRPYLPGPGGVYLVQGGVPGLGSCAWSRGVYLALGGCTWSRGGVPGPEGCTWSGGVYLVWGVYLVPGGCTWSRGVPGPRGVYLVLGGVPGPRGVPGPGGCTWSWGEDLVRYPPPPVNRITDACKNITLPQLRCGR